ncbi:MAG: EamA family transporter [Xanthobacteraceae bacterium]
MLGGFFALMAAATFAWTNAVVRRGVVTGSVSQAITLAIPPGIPIFFAALLVSGNPGILFQLSERACLVFAAVGISHFCIGRYCNYRALSAIGTNLAGPVMQLNLLVSLSLAIFFLGEKLTVVRIVGILMIVAGTVIVRRGGAAAAAAKPATAAAFTPRLAEGYFFAFLAALFYGASPALVRYAVEGKGLAASLAGGVVASTSATILMTLLLIVPSQMEQLRGVSRENAKWFFISGTLVYVSQIFAYMAVAIAPVTITAPIIGLSNIFRLYLARVLNPHHEVFGSEVIFATAVSFLGVVVLSDAVPLPQSWAPVLNWQWP